MVYESNAKLDLKRFIINWMDVDFQCRSVFEKKYYYFLLHQCWTELNQINLNWAELQMKYVPSNEQKSHCQQHLTEVEGVCISVWVHFGFFTNLKILKAKQSARSKQARFEKPLQLYIQSGVGMLQNHFADNTPLLLAVIRLTLKMYPVRNKGCWPASPGSCLNVLLKTLRRYQNEKSEFTL